MVVLLLNNEAEINARDRDGYTPLHIAIDQNSFNAADELLEAGAKKQKLRAHSDYYPNEEANAWALSFWDQFDIQCEAKAKNLASEQLYLQAQSNYKNT